MGCIVSKHFLDFYIFFIFTTPLRPAPIYLIYFWQKRLDMHFAEMSKTKCPVSASRNRQARDLLSCDVITKARKFTKEKLCAFVLQSSVTSNLSAEISRNHVS